MFLVSTQLKLVAHSSSRDLRSISGFTHIAFRSFSSTEKQRDDSDIQGAIQRWVSFLRPTRTKGKDIEEQNDKVRYLGNLNSSPVIEEKVLYRDIFNLLIASTTNSKPSQLPNDEANKHWFTLEVKKSNIVNANNGVFISHISNQHHHPSNSNTVTMSGKINTDRREVNSHHSHEDCILKEQKLKTSQESDFSQPSGDMEDRILKGQKLKTSSSSSTFPALRVVALYPGYYYPPPPMWAISSNDGQESCLSQQSYYVQHSGYQKTELESMYQIHCNSYGGYLDGLFGEQFILQRTVDEEKTQILSKDHEKFNYCIGHLVNHPSANFKPNVYAVDFSWQDVFAFILKDSTISSLSYDELDSLRRQVNDIGHGLWYIDMQTMESIALNPKNCKQCCGIAMVSTCEIPIHEEVYVDYRYEPNNYPIWYTPVKY